MWSTTPISWDGFYEVAPNNDSSLSNFSYRIGIRYEKKIITDTLLVHTEVYAYMSKKNSWVKNEAKTKQFLAYHQILLNMLELYRRKIQNVYYTLDNPYTADSLFEDYSKAYETERVSFSNQYFSSSNKDSLINHFLNTTNNVLNEETNNSIPNHDKKSLGYGINASIGYLTLNNSLGKKFTNTPIFNAGIDLSYKKIVFGINGYMGWNKVKNEFSYTENTWNKGLKTGIISVELSIGYNIQLNKISFRPFGGINFLQLAPTTNLNAFNGYTIGGNTLVAGVIGDYKLKKVLKLVPGSLFYNRVYSEMDIQFKFSYLPLDFRNNFQSNSILLTVGISTLSRVIEVH